MVCVEVFVRHLGMELNIVVKLLFIIILLCNFYIFFIMLSGINFDSYFKKLTVMHITHAKTIILF